MSVEPGLRDDRSTDHPQTQADMSAPTRIAPAPAATWVDCLFGAPCPVPITLSARDRRIRLFRDSPYASLLFSKNRFARLLYRDWRYTACWAQILLHSAALNGGRVEPISLRRIATSACLSIPTVVAVLAHAEATGAIAKHRFEDDRRLLILVPSAAMLAFTESVCAQWSASAASMVGRGNPWDQMQPADRLSLQRVLCIAAAQTYRQLGRTEHGFDRKTFAFSMLDLLIEPGQRMAAFVPHQAERLRVTQQTIRNIVARAGRTGWLATGEALTLSAMGEERICAALSLIEFRWKSILEALDTPGRLQELDAAMTADFRTLRPDPQVPAKPSPATSPGPG